MNNINYYLLLLLIITFSCTNKRTDVKSENTVLIIKDYLSDSDYISPGGDRIHNSYAGTISYIVNGKPYYYKPLKYPDTVFINNTTPYTEVSILNQNVEEYYSLLKQGDTVSLTIDENKAPVLKSHSSEQLTGLYNGHHNLLTLKSHSNFEPLTLLLHSGDYLRKLAIAPPSIFEKYKDDYIPIDTLKNLFHEYTNIYEKYIAELANNKSVPKEYVEYNTYLLNLKQLSYIISNYQYDNIEFDPTPLNNILSDDLLNYASYHLFIDTYLNLFFDKYNSVPSIRVANGEYGDNRLTFDLLAENSMIPPKTKTILLGKTLKQIIDNFSTKEIEYYINKYYELTQDSVTISYFTDKYNLDFAKYDEIILEDIKGKESTLQDILDNNTGKVLYIDFWASWCAPCLAAMPAAKELREKYNGKDIVFVYLAFNDEKEKWKDKIEKLELNLLKECYIIKNSKSAHLIDSLNIRTIPRYILYDKKGDIFHPNAPGPESTEIINLLDELTSGVKISK